jgi:hypothetical protein
MPRVCLALVLSVLFLLGGAAELGAELPLDKIKDSQLRTRLRLAGLQIFFGESVVAMTNAHAIGWEVFHEGKKRRERELAYSLALQALAEASLELNREALWHWSMAQMLLPELQGEVLQAYSGIAELFDSSPYRSRASALAWIEQESLLLTPGEEFTAPIAIEKGPVPTPQTKPSALNGQRLTLSFLVDPDGWPYSPVIERGGKNSLAVFTALHSVMGWRFEPARQGDQTGWALASTIISFEREK